MEVFPNVPAKELSTDKEKQITLPTSPTSAKPRSHDEGNQY